MCQCLYVCVCMFFAFVMVTLVILWSTQVSLDRLWKFLQEEELPKDVVIHVPKDQNQGIAIKIEGGQFSWNPSITPETLNMINLEVKVGTHVAVCGTVGSGKSSLLSCILGEIPKLAGTVRKISLDCHHACSEQLDLKV